MLKLIFIILLFVNIIILFYNILINIPDLKEKLNQESDLVKELVTDKNNLINDIINDTELKADFECCNNIMTEKEIQNIIEYNLDKLNNNIIINNKIKNYKDLGFNFDISDTSINFKNNVRINNNINNLDENLIINNNIGISKDLKVNNLIDSDYLNEQILIYSPQFSIIPWNSEQIPYGWKLCDGKKYMINSNNEIIKIEDETLISSEDEDKIISTPDLRNVFLKGYNSNTMSDLYGGRSEVILTEQNLPKHKHKYERAKLISGWGLDVQDRSMDYDVGYDTIDTDDSNCVPENTNVPCGTPKPFSIMPPYYEINYIIKISNEISEIYRENNPSDNDNNFGLV